MTHFFFDHDRYEEHSHMWGIDVPGPKYSHAIYTSFLTGLPSTVNLEGKPLTNDHLLLAIKRAAGMFCQGPYSSSSSSSSSQQLSATPPSLHYVGPKWSFLTLVEDDEEEEEQNNNNEAKGIGRLWREEDNRYDHLRDGKRVFDEVSVIEEPLDVDYSHVYPFFFEKPTDRKGRYDVERFLMQEIVARNASLVSHSAVFDHRQHGEFKDYLSFGGPETTFPWTSQAAATFNADLKRLKGILDEKLPEYLLVMLSDHGVDSQGIAGYKMHGDSAEGNSGFLMIYNRALHPYRSADLIPVVDVAPTLAPYLGAGIPGNSMGVSHAFPTLSSSSTATSSPPIGAQFTDLNPGEAPPSHRPLLHRALLLLSNIRQLAQVASDRMMSFSEAPEAPVRLLDSEEDMAAWVVALEAHAQELSDGLFTTGGWMTVAMLAVYVLIGSGVVLWVLLNQNLGLEYVIINDNWGDFNRCLWSIFVVYGPAFLNILSVWAGWPAMINSGHLFQLNSTLYAWYIIARLELLRSPSDPLSVPHDEEAAPAVPSPSPLRHQDPPSTEEAEAQAHSLLASPPPTSQQKAGLQDFYLHARNCLLSCEMWHVFCSFRRHVFGELAIALEWTPLPLVLLGCAMLVNHFVRSSHPDGRGGVDVVLILSSFALISGYHYTAEDAAMHWCPFGLHCCVFLLLLLLLLFTCNLLCAAAVSKQPMLCLVRLWVPSLLFLCLLSHDSSSQVLFLCMLPHFFNSWLWPVFHFVSHRTIKLTQIKTRAQLNGLSVRDHFARLQDASLVAQLLCFYSINAFLFQFTVSFGDVFDFSVHPMVGRVGMLSYDQHPLLSSFFMLFHKYGLFLSLLPLFAFSINRLPWPLSHDSPALLAHASHTLAAHDHSWYRHSQLVCFFVLFCCTTIGYHLQQVAFDRTTNTDVTISFLLSLGFSALLYALLELVNRLSLSLRPRQLLASSKITSV